MTLAAIVFSMLKITAGHQIFLRFWPLVMHCLPTDSLFILHAPVIFNYVLQCQIGI